MHLDLHDVYERFLGELGPGAHILDAGCGSGRDTKAFSDRAYGSQLLTLLRKLPDWHPRSQVSRAGRFDSKRWSIERSLTAYGHAHPFFTFPRTRCPM